LSEIPTIFTQSQKMKRGPLLLDEDNRDTICWNFRQKVIWKVAENMLKKNVRSALIVDENFHVMGIVSSKRIMKVFVNEIDRNVAAEKQMRHVHKLIFYDSLAPIQAQKQILKDMERLKLDHVPEVREIDGINKIVGIVTVKDIIEFMKIFKGVN
jgi:predicted transcriptional regulator